MKKETIYKIAIGILLAVNLLQLYKFLPPIKQDVFRDKAIQMMNLNEKQKELFKNFAEEHRSKMDALYNKQTQLTSQYFDKPSDSLLHLIAKIETEKITVTEQHFSKIKSILKKEQIPQFEKFKKKALNLILKEKPSVPSQNHLEKNK